MFKTESIMERIIKNPATRADAVSIPKSENINEKTAHKNPKREAKIFCARSIGFFVAPVMFTMLNAVILRGLYFIFKKALIK